MLRNWRTPKLLKLGPQWSSRSMWNQAQPPYSALQCQPSELIEVDTSPAAMPAKTTKDEPRAKRAGAGRGRTPPPF